MVVGGGPTGVELAGTLAEIARQALANEFRTIDPKKTRIMLLEGGPRVLAGVSGRSFAQRGRAVAALGVEVHTSAMVTKVSRERCTSGKPSCPPR